MDVDSILQSLHNYEVDYLLIGGVNFLLRHKPTLTFDTDIWVRDEDVNLGRLNHALRELGAAWGATESSWGPVPDNPSWLKRQMVFCLTTKAGAMDVFRTVRGLENRYDECRKEAVCDRTGTDVPYSGLSDRHMLEAALSLDAKDQKAERISILQDALAIGGKTVRKSHGPVERCREPRPDGRGGIGD
jgi:hypothetical protein